MYSANFKHLEEGVFVACKARILTDIAFRSMVTLILVCAAFITPLGRISAMADAAPGTITTVAVVHGSLGTSIVGGYSTSVAVDASGNLYIADGGTNIVYKVDTRGIITTVAGNGTRGDSGDGGPATSAEIDYPSSIAVDTAGNLYIADGARVRKVDTKGIITTIAGNGTRGDSGDGGPATSAELNLAAGVTVDTAGNLYIADWGNNRVRKVDTKGIITTVAGNGTQGYARDGGPATSAELNKPVTVALDPAGNLYIADQGNSIYRVDKNGVITGREDNTCAPLTSTLNGPNSMAVDAAGNLYFADLNGVKKLFNNGIIVPIAGNEFSSVEQYGSYGVAVDAAGNLYVSNAGFVRKVTVPIPLSGMIVFIIGHNTYTVDSQSYAIDVCPFVLNGRAFVPVRYLADSLGAQTGWNPTSQSVTITKGNTTVKLTIGSTTLKTNGTESQMDVVPVIQNDRTYLPALYVAQAFNCNVMWDADSQSVILAPPSMIPR
jgi:sugar lactone lactonase YvrE